MDVWGPAPRIPRPPRPFVRTPAGIDWGVFPEEDRLQADWNAEAAIAQPKAIPARRPFFVSVGFRLPHVPCYASKKWFDLFPPEEEIELPAVKDDDRADVPDFARYLHW